MSIKDNINAFKNKLKGTNCRLVAVSKTKPNEDILQALSEGQLDFGENKVQELVAKSKALPNEIRWHMIGHLQRNKVKQIAPFVHLIHSVDSLRLLNEINKQGQNLGRIIPCLLQVHIAREETKFGFTKEEILGLLDSQDMMTLNNIKIQGLMAMATNTPDVNVVRGEFKTVHDLFLQIYSLNTSTNIDMKELSIGMTSDYELAIEEGSTLIRIGSAIFGFRNNPKTM